MSISFKFIVLLFPEEVFVPIKLHFSYQLAATWIGELLMFRIYRICCVLGILIRDWSNDDSQIFMYIFWTVTYTHPPENVLILDTVVNTLRPIAKRPYICRQNKEIASYKNRTYLRVRPPIGCPTFGQQREFFPVRSNGSMLNILL